MQITVRGITYPSEQACADAFNITLKSVQKARRAGRLNTLGLGKKGQGNYNQGKAFSLAGVTFSSHQEASRLIGKSPNYVNTVLNYGKEGAKRNLIKLVLEYKKRNNIP